MFTDCRQRGLTLIELIIFIVIVSVALVGVLTVFNVTTKSSADPMIRKQMLAIAEAVLEEVLLQPFTWCDPDDRSAATATSADPSGIGGVDPTKCRDAVEGLGTETVSGNTDARLSLTSPFDNVSDYNGLTNVTTGVTGAGSPIPTGYSASVVVSNDAAFGPAGSQPPSAAVLLVAVTVCHAVACPSAGADSIVLEGYRTRHSPNMLP